MITDTKLRVPNGIQLLYQVLWGPDSTQTIWVLWYCPQFITQSCALTRTIFKSAIRSKHKSTCTVFNRERLQRLEMDRSYSFLFLSLPSELRQKVCESLSANLISLTCNSKASTQKLGEKNPESLLDILNFARTCKTVRVEALRILFAKMVISSTCPETSPLKQLQILTRRGVANFRPAEHIISLNIYFPRKSKRKYSSFIQGHDIDHAAVLSSTQNLPTIVSFLKRKFPRLCDLRIRTASFYDLFNKEGIPHSYILRPLCCGLPQLQYVGFDTDSLLAHGHCASRFGATSTVLGFGDIICQCSLVCMLTRQFNRNLHHLLESTLSDKPESKHGDESEGMSSPKLPSDRCIFHPSNCGEDAGKLMLKQMEDFAEQLGVRLPFFKTDQEQENVARYQLRSRNWNELDKSNHDLILGRFTVAEAIC